MQPSTATSDKYPRHSSRSSKKPFYAPASAWERLAYGGGVLLLTSGPVLIGVDMVSWMAVFMGINVGVIVICCLLGAWRNLKGSHHRR